ncbi:MAG: methyltransferase domain-containing protein [Anaerolineae bacterium]|nr:methyltransferase domain-containing protein [Anaerolineae bacterium]
MLSKLKQKFSHTTPTPVDILTGYAHWAESYQAAPHNPLMEVEQQAMLSLMPVDLRDYTCLDVACGSGRYILLLQARRAGQVVGVDYSADMLAQAKKVDLGGQLIRGPFSPLPFPDNSFDLISCGMAVGHEKNLAQVIGELFRVLRFGGLLIYSDLHPFGATAGWKRTFAAANGTTYQLEHHFHTIDDHHAACRQAGLKIETILEPTLNPESAPHPNPVVLVIKAVKPSPNLQSPISNL